jgi:hypothetical protein
MQPASPERQRMDILHRDAHDRFYVLPHGQIAASVAVRMKDIVDGRQPT